MRDLGVHAAHEGFDQPAGVRSVAAPLRFHVAAVREQAGERVALDVVGTGDFREPSFSRPTPELHLPQPILGGDKPLREEKVVYGLGVHMRDAPPIAEDLDRTLKPVERDLSIDLGERRLGAGTQVG